MRMPDELSRKQLQDLVASIQEFMFQEYDELNDCERWNIDKEVNGGDLVEYVAERLAEYGLAPDVEGED